MTRDKICKIEAKLDSLYEVPIQMKDKYTKTCKAEVGSWFGYLTDNDKGYNEYLVSIGYDILFITPDGNLHSWIYYYGRKYTPTITRKKGDMIAVRTRIIEPSSEVTNTSLDDYDIFEV